MPKALHSCSCTARTDRSAKRSAFPVLTGIFIAVLPKCPFCILAYSSAITMCGVNGHIPAWTSWISIALAVLTLLFVLLNNRGRRTILAAVLVIAGSLFIIHSEMISGSMENYYLGASLLLAGVWTNASLLYFLRKLKGQLIKAVRLLNQLADLSSSDGEGYKHKNY
ncbi:MAG: hypothetical protein AAF598_10090 [Bacteroidota bacterium]